MNYRARVEELNYHSDPRVTARKWGGFDKFDPQEMKLYTTLYGKDEDEEGEPCEYEYEAEFPAKYEVCDLCEGQGKHVNPSIDCGGISAEEMYEDPDFAEAYFGGAFDVPCNQCRGLRVSPVVDEDLLSEEQKKNWKLFLELQEDRAMLDAEYAAERRMGA